MGSLNNGNTLSRQTSATVNNSMSVQVDTTSAAPILLARTQAFSQERMALMKMSNEDHKFYKKDLGERWPAARKKYWNLKRNTI